MERKQLKVSEILEDLDKGMTRLKKDDAGLGSIEDKYELSANQVKQLFAHPKLRNRKTRKVGIGLSYDLIDDVEDIDISDDAIITAEV